MTKAYSALPPEMRNDQVRIYYERLKQPRVRVQIALKYALDFLLALVLQILLLPLFLIIALWIKLDRSSKGPVFFRQERVGQYGKPFRIYKFRTMRVAGDDSSGEAGRPKEAEGTEDPQDARNAQTAKTPPQRPDARDIELTVGEDPRITKPGRFLRKLRLDEIPQLLNILRGEMSFVGTRPEVPRYVAQYEDAMWATLLMRPGVTSEASIRYKDEAEILEGAEDPERAYVEEVLPQKMAYNLSYLEKFSLGHDLKLIFQTVVAVLR